MARGIDSRLGKALGLVGRHAEVPAFEIVNDAHSRFLSSTSRLITLEYGSNGDAFKNHPLWPLIDRRRSHLAGQLSVLGGDAIGAAALLEEIRQLDEVVDGVAAELNAAGGAE